MAQNFLHACVDEWTSVNETSVLFTCLLFICLLFTCLLFTCLLFICLLFTCLLFTCLLFTCLQDEELLFMSHGYRGPRKVDESDELAGEFKVVKEKQTTEKPTVHK